MGLSSVAREGIKAKELRDPYGGVLKLGYPENAGWLGKIRTYPKDVIGLALGRNGHLHMVFMPVLRTEF